ncbi:hypothetical protein AYI70_g10205 [Smittium culicis]|uniref:Ribophorin II n=1 Tax=Smittium culicis TaxID=133412 RepID=A0A1R1X7N4_9FUNG|nr:hypothetical protein AYI70_g11404 [Smittium culicis]OMJ10644.1 hypothetical protein AYI70_g10205 [Smittium culicis]
MLASIVLASSYEIKPNKISVNLVDKLGDVVTKERPEYPEKLKKRFELESGSKIVVEFEAISSSKDHKHIPLNQAALVLTSLDKTSQTSISSKFSEAKNSYKIIMNKLKIENHIASNGEYSADLVLGSFSEKTGAVYNLGVININCFKSSIEKSDHIIYGPKPEIFHTFSAPQKMVNPLVSVIYTALITIPFALFFTMLGSSGFLSAINKNATVSDYSFFGCILSYASLIISYFIGVKIFPILFYGLVLAIPTFIFGQKSLFK